MITSMTGYGEGQARGAGWLVTVKIKTLNHRYLDLQIQGLEDFSLELQALELLKRSFRRGRVEVQVTLEREGENIPRFDAVTARQHYEGLKQLARDLGLGEQISLDHLLRLGGGALKVLSADPKVLWSMLQEALQRAIDAAQRMRLREGEALAAELSQRLQALQNVLAGIEARAPQVKLLYRERLRQNILELQPQIELDPGRLEQEVALWAERSDITEELGRLKIHLAAAQKAIEGPEPAGRTLDFLAQEMYRETNTMAAKARDGEIAQKLIEMKGLIESLREQVRNVE